MTPLRKENLAYLFLCEFARWSGWKLFASHSFFQSPAVGIDAARKRKLADTEFLRPFAEKLGSSVKGYVAICSRVPRLNFLRCPTNIAWRISFFIVDSVNAVFGTWLWSQNGKKSIECAKFGRDRNAAPSVIRIGGASRVLATGDHAAPTNVFARECLAMPSFDPLQILNRIAVFFANAIKHARRWTFSERIQEPSEDSQSRFAWNPLFPAFLFHAMPLIICAGRRLPGAMPVFILAHVSLVSHMYVTCREAIYATY